MKKKVLFIATLLCIYGFSFGQANIDNFFTATQWDAMFPKRAGIEFDANQTYNFDFFSFANLKKAIVEMADYEFTFRNKKGVYGQVVTVRRKSTNVTYTYKDADPWWYTSTTPETVIKVDFGDFINTASASNNKRELAAFLANISKETTGGWEPVGSGTNGDYAKWGLHFVYEVGSPGDYTSADAEYPAVAGKKYYGRGAIQLSYNYNYGPFSKLIFDDKNVLLNDPDKVQRDGDLGFKTAIWFWMMPQWPKPSCHQVMHDLWTPLAGEYTQSKMYKKGFAHTNNIINGGVECRGSNGNLVVIRSELYKYYLKYLGFSVPQITAEDSGNYSTLCYESPNAMENYLSANVTLGSENFDLSNFGFYPNPFTNNLTLKYKNPISRVQVLNLLGQSLLDLSPNTPETTLDMAHFAPGTYIAKVSAGNGNATIKIIKE
jgi:basic endochitinase B